MESITIYFQYLPFACFLIFVHTSPKLDLGASRSAGGIRIITTFGKILNPLRPNTRTWF